MMDDDLREKPGETEQPGERLEKFTSNSKPVSMLVFDPTKFHRVLLGYVVPPLVLVWLIIMGLLLLSIRLRETVSDATIFGIPLFKVSQLWSGWHGEWTLAIVAMGEGAIGLVSYGGLAIGGLAIGGLSLGIIAIGGGAVGLFAIGGGAFGLVAFGGGGPCGYVAIGAGSIGVYVLGVNGRGKYVFSRKRQDEEAIRFFCKYLPRLRQAFT